MCKRVFLILSLCQENFLKFSYGLGIRKHYILIWEYKMETFLEGVTRLTVAAVSFCAVFSTSASILRQFNEQSEKKQRLKIW